MEHEALGTPHVAPSEHPPQTWREFRGRSTRPWARPLLYLDWLMANLAWYLSQWSLLKVLAYAETFSVLVALIFWVAETGERKQQKHYQAWQVINTAQGKSGSGGRIEALEQLNEDHVPLVGVDVSKAFLQNVRLDKAELRRATFRDADLRSAHFHRAGLQDTDFTSANLRGADVRNADLSDATLTDSDLTGADFRNANVHHAAFDKADLRGVDLGGITDWHSISSIRLADIFGVKNAPDGFVQWAIQNGAVQLESTDAWDAALKAK